MTSPFTPLTLAQRAAQHRAQLRAQTLRANDAEPVAPVPALPGATVAPTKNEPVPPTAAAIAPAPEHEPMTLPVVVLMAPSNVEPLTTADVEPLQTPVAAPAAEPLPGPEPVPVPEPAPIHRVLVTRQGATRKTTVSVPEDEYQRLMHFAHNDPRACHKALREAALALPPYSATPLTMTYEGLSTRKKQDFSAQVRAKALKSLQGSYRPEVAAELATEGALGVEEAAAVVNNEVWAAESA